MCGCHDQVVAALEVQLAHVVLELLAEDASARVPDPQARAELVGRGEEIELAPELAVVALLRFLQPHQVRIEVRVRRPGRAVDARQHRPLLVAAPIRAGDVGQPERSEPPGGRHVRPQTQVGPRPVAVDGDGVADGDLALDVGVAQTLDDLHLVRLIGEAVERLGPRDLLPDERDVGRYQLAHPCFDRGEVVRRERLSELEVVVEPVIDRRPDGVLRAGTQIADGSREDVRGGMPQHVEAVVLRGDTASTADSDAGTNDRSRSSPSTRAAIASGGRTEPTGSPSGRSVCEPSMSFMRGMAAMISAVDALFVGDGLEDVQLGRSAGRPDRGEHAGQRG